jgi:3-phenylpropionate/trans-cinnamate dioxygenase ferredoxin reductase component
MSTQTFAIIGAGHAGTSAAAAMRAAGFEGRIVLVSDEKHAPYERPPLSKEVLVAPEKARLPIQPPEFYADKRIELRLGDKAVAIDPAAKKVLFNSGEKLAYDKLLLACGARARAYPLLDALGEGVHKLRTLDDAQKLRGELTPGKKILIVGGGVIGLEVASSAVNLGLHATVLERAPRLLARGAPAPLAEFLRQKHESRGVKLETSVDLIETERGADGKFHLKAADGRDFTGDLIVYGVGVELNLDLAREAEVKIENGVVVDQCGRTSDPSIYAAGDIACQVNPFFGAHVRQETWANAVGQGAGVGRAMVTGEPCDFEPPWFWTDQFMSNFQVAGRTEAEEWIARGDVANGKFILFGLTDRIVTGAIAFDNGRDMRPARMLIAAGARPDPLALADPKADLRRLAQSFV